HRDPVLAPEGERGDVRGASLVSVLQIPGGGAGVEHADRGRAVAVPVADHRDPVARAVGERLDVGSTRAVRVAQIPGAAGETTPTVGTRSPFQSPTTGSQPRAPYAKAPASAAPGL